MLQNINGIPEQPTTSKSRQIADQISNSGADAWMIQETGLCWAKVDDLGQWQERTRTHGTRLNSNFQYNKTEIERTEVLQAGGIAVITTTALTPRCCSQGGDPTGLGRWAWTRLEGSNGFHTRIVSVYRPCVPSGQGSGTVFEQHRRFFGQEDIDPRQSVLDSLEVAIKEWQEMGDVIIVGMDANEDTRKRKLREFFDNLDMKNAILERHKYLSPPATHSRNTNREPIDGIWVSKSLDPVRAGFLAVGSACPSDHVALWIDVNIDDVLGPQEDHTVPKINRMKASDPRLVKKYNDLSKKALLEHQVPQQLKALAKIPRHQWTEEATDQFNQLQRINTEVRKQIGASIRKVFLGHFPWSPPLQRFYDKIELMKLIVRKRQGVRTSMTKIRRHASHRRVECHKTGYRSSPESSIRFFYGL
jgi:hypothetical protein